MKRRSNIFICMEILGLLLEGPRGPTKMAQATGLNFDKFLEFANLLDSKHFIRKELQEGHELYYITSEGVEFYGDIKKVAEKLEV